MPNDFERLSRTGDGTLGEGTTASRTLPPPSGTTAGLHASSHPYTPIPILLGGCGEGLYFLSLSSPHNEEVQSPVQVHYPPAVKETSFHFYFLTPDENNKLYYLCYVYFKMHLLSILLTMESVIKVNVNCLPVPSFPFFTVAFHPPRNAADA